MCNSDCDPRRPECTPIQPTRPKYMSREQTEGRAPDRIYIGQPSSNPVNESGLSLLHERVFLERQVEILTEEVSDLTAALEASRATCTELRNQRGKLREDLDGLWGYHNTLLTRYRQMEESRESWANSAEKWTESFASEAAVNEKLRATISELAVESSSRCVCVQLRAFEDSFRPVDPMSEEDFDAEHTRLRHCCRCDDWCGMSIFDTKYYTCGVEHPGYCHCKGKAVSTITDAFGSCDDFIPWPPIDLTKGPATETTTETTTEGTPE